ncbi:MAG: hypothetical protein U0516_03830 [Candidatus Saccharibacteria bacterium]
MSWINHSYTRIVAVFFALAILFTPAAVLAEGLSTQSYQIQPDVVAGAAVVLKDNTISLAVAGNEQYLYGVAVGSSDVVINVSGTARPPIITDGQAKVAATDINGEIQVGDQLTASPIAGVVMKATQSTRVLGTAAQSFATAGKDQTTQTRVLTAKDGNTTTANIRLLPVVVNVSDYQSSSPSVPAVLLPLQQILNGASGKTVSTERTILVTIIILIAVVVSLVILYSSASSSIRSIGRNPTAKNAIFLSLLQVVGMIAVIFIVAFVIIKIIIRG